MERVQQTRASERCTVMLRRQIELLARMSQELDRLMLQGGGSPVSELAQALEISEREAAELLGRLA